jgi:hypothetical protein
MPLPIESIDVGKCYLADRRQRPQVWRVERIFPDGRLDYMNRPVDPSLKQVWRSGMTTLAFFAGVVSCEVPCDWIPENDG